MRLRPLLRFRLLCVLVAIPAAAAQPARAPFETLAVSVGGVATLGGAPYTDYWSPGPGVEGRVTTPFYLGQVAVGAVVAPHEASGDGLPDYLSFYFYGVWGADLALPGGLRLSPGLSAGLFRMEFDTDDAVAVRNESELAVGPELWLSGAVAPGWRVRAGVGGARIFTAERIDLRFVRVGVSRAFRTPGWIEGVLR
jgi:hypothetical protein